MNISLFSMLSILAIDAKRTIETEVIKGNKLAMTCFCIAWNMLATFFNVNSKQIDKKTMVVIILIVFRFITSLIKKIEISRVRIKLVPIIAKANVAINDKK